MPFKLAALRESVRPFKLHWYPRVRSTNDHAATLRRRGELFAPAIVLTAHQLAGRGRGSNTWWSAEGGLTVTFAVAQQETILPHQVPLIAGLAVRDAAAEIVGDSADIELKWPNDLLVGDRKLAGLLCERINRSDLIGIGLNVNIDPGDVPRQLRSRLASLQEIVGHPLDMNDVLATIARHIHARFSGRNTVQFSRVLVEYDRHHALRGKRIRIIQSPGEPVLSGMCVGMDSMGRLLLSTPRGTERIISGQVDRKG